MIGRPCAQVHFRKGRNEEDQECRFHSHRLSLSKTFATYDLDLRHVITKRHRRVLEIDVSLHDAYEGDFRMERCNWDERDSRDSEA